MGRSVVEIYPMKQSWKTDWKRKNGESNDRIKNRNHTAKSVLEANFSADHARDQNKRRAVGEIKSKNEIRGRRKPGKYGDWVCSAAR